MQSKAYLRYLRIAPRKVRLLADLIRGKQIDEAQTILRFAQKGGANPLLKLLNSAVASGTHNFQLNPAHLYVAKIIVNEGPKLKRVFERARGRADQIQKKTSHITVVLDERMPSSSEGRVDVQKEISVAQPKERIPSQVGKQKFRLEKDAATKQTTIKPFKLFRRKVV